MAKERELSEKEIQRKRLFDEKAKKLIADGYTQKTLTIGVVKANILAVLVTLPFLLVMALIWYLRGNKIYLEITIMTYILFLLSMFVLVVIHELIHGITWAIFAENHWKDIEFGVIWKMLTPYCTCGCVLTRMQYMIGVLMPTLILGVGLGIISVIMENFFLFLLAEVMMLGGGGDFLIFGKLLMFRKKDKDCIFIDHPTECGLIAFYKD